MAYGLNLSKIAPARFLAFLLLLAGATALSVAAFGFVRGTMVGFDIAALAFLVSCIPLFRRTSKEMRRSSERNDANRPMLIVISFAVAAVILILIVLLLNERGSLGWIVKLLIVVTLVLAWTFGNSVYTLHYAHLFYSKGETGKDAGGLDFPGTDEPSFADFAYFSFTLGVALQTSDVTICSAKMRNLVTVHCVVAFFFNLGVLALTINVLGST